MITHRNENMEEIAIESREEIEAEIEGGKR
jgi:hypothetical protein